MIETVKFHCFKCLPKVGDVTDLNAGEYLLQSEPYSKGCSIQINTYTFFGRAYNESIWATDIKNILFQTKKGIKQLEQAALKTECSATMINYYEIRHQVCELWLAARDIIFKYCDLSQYNDILKYLVSSLNEISNGMTELKEIPDYVLFNSVKNTDMRFSAPYNYVHLYLDLKWISLTISNNIFLNKDSAEEQICSILKNLIYISVKKFERNILYLDSNSPFLCSCFKELWLLVQLFIELNSNCLKDFWSYFNQTLKESVKFQVNADGKDALCCLWILSSVAKIQGYDQKGNFIGINNSRVLSNYTLVEDCLKHILQATCDEKRMRSALQLIAFLQVKWWTRDATFDLLQMQWEHFYKRIHSSFALTTDTSVFINTSQKFYNFVELTENILTSNLETCTSYEIFLYLLNYFLKRSPSFWSKLKGRIYSKLSASKLASFKEVGLQNLITLLLVLSNSVNFNELTEKLLSLLNQLPPSFCEENYVVWSAYISLIILYVKRDMFVNNISSSLLHLVEQASINRSRSSLMKLFINGLDLLQENSNNLQYGQHVLFASSWIKNYLLWCSHTDACNLLDLLIKITDKLKSHDLNRNWSITLENQILPSLLHLASGTDAPGQIAQLAATIVSTDCQKYTQVVEQFTSDSINLGLVEQFLRCLLEKADIHQLVGHQTVLIQAWIKINMLSEPEHYLSDITSTISRFPEWTKTFGSFDVMETEDIICVVIKSAGNRVREAKNITEVASMKRWFELYFGRMDSWVQTLINPAEKNEKNNNKLLIRIYTYGALLFIHCASALYIKNKSSNLLHRLISTMLLPSAILMNKKPPDSALAALKITWHLFVKGLVQLDYNSDIYIERILKDMVIRYVPHFSETDSPLIRCLDSEFKDKDTVFIIEKIVTLISHRSRTVNEFAPQALHLILEMFLTKKDVNKVKILIKICIPALLELVMFVQNAMYKKIITSIFYAIINHSQYSNIKDTVIMSITKIIDKHLAFYSHSVFQMLEFLAKNMKTEIKNITPYLKNSIEKVEKMRVEGYDNTLRKGLRDIQQIVNDKI